LDFVLGVACQVAVQYFAFDRWLTPTRPIDDVVISYGSNVRMNLAAKVLSKLEFLGDVVPFSPLAVVLGLLALLLLAVYRTRPTPALRS
jgi:hypothetical protein